MNYTKFLLAAEIRKLAEQRRHEAADNSCSHLSGEAREVERKLWLAKYSAMSFISIAVAEITNIAEMIEPITDSLANVEINFPT